MQSVRFQDFRGFHDSGWLELRPITLLIGENSTGKTSFLAGLRYLLQAFQRSSTTPFNREPYYLGGFNEIARYHGGQGRRAKSFKLSIRHGSASSGGSEDKTSAHRYEHQFTFGKGAPQPLIRSYRSITGLVDTEFSFEKEMPQAILTRVDQPNLKAEWALKRSPPSEIIKDNNSFISYLYDDLLFLRSRQGGHEADVASILEQLKLGDDDLPKFASLRRELYSSLQQFVFASAPVRTQPLRTYTPSEVTLSSEGSHVPLELARIKSRSKEEWHRVKERLIAFGEKAHLFTDVDIKQFGRTDTDPFQLMFKVAGPAMNVVDVGYGISQILPIVYQIQNPGRYSTFLLQQPEVHLHPRAQAELGTLFSSAVKSVKHPLFVLETHSDYIVDRLRIEIAEGKLLAENVTIIFFKQQQYGMPPVNIFFDKNGDMEDAPDDLRGFFLEEHARLLGL